VKNNLFLLFAILFLATNNMFAQEQLVPLRNNAQLIENIKNHDERAVYPPSIYYVMDTLNLPFIDDFSSNKFQEYYYYAHPTNVIATKTIYSFELTPITVVPVNPHPSTLVYSRTRQWDSIYVSPNWTRQVADSFNLSFYTFNNKIYPVSPFVPDSTFKIYLGGIIDTLATSYPPVFQNDSTLIQVNLFTENIEVVTIKNSNLKGLWMDMNRGVNINNTFAINPPTIGVATFDGLTYNGMPYNFSTPSTNGRADYLTSKPLNLSNLNNTPYLSFYWQRKGLGDEPEFADSLILQFRTPALNWETIKVFAGGQGDTIFNKTTIKIDSAFWKVQGFQFRFINRATLSGANDHWHLDYVRLVPNAIDTIFKDLAFADFGNTLLNGYSAVPYTQYTPSLISNSSLNFISNISTSSLNTNYNYVVSDFYGQIINYQFNVGNITFAQNEVNNCQFCGSVLNPLSTANINIPVLSECTEYKVKQWIQPLNLAENIRENDTTVFIQHFSDYFAYDDGSAESGYLLTNPGADMVAQFELTTADNINGMRIFFDPVNDDFTGLEFYIRVWNDTVVLLNGVPFNRPGHVLKEYGPFTPTYINADNKSAYAEYIFDASFALPIGKFYAGIYKENATGINIGFDRNSNNQTKMFFTPVANVWGNTQFEGTYMMRPLFGNCPNGVPSKIEENNIVNSFTIYPNPANDVLNIEVGSACHSCAGRNLIICDLLGNEVMNIKPKYDSETLNFTLSISNLNSGIYFVKIVTSNGEAIGVQKLSIVR